MKKVIPFVVLFFAFLIGIVALVFFFFKSYKEKNTWAVFEITQTSSHGVVSTKEYKKGEKLEIHFATVMVETVHSDEYAVISCEDADIIFHGKAVHEAQLVPGDEVAIQTEEYYYTVKMVRAYYW